MRRLLLPLAAAAMLAGGCAHPQAAAPPSAPAPLQVKTITVHAVPEAQTVEYAGVVRPWHTVSLSTRATGRVTAVTVDDGDPVRRGQVLARVDMATTQAQTGQAQAAVALSLAGVATSQQGVQRAEAAVAEARARLPQIQDQLREAIASQAQARIDLDRAESLYRQDAGPRATVDRARTDLKVAQARVATWQAAIVHARREVGLSAAEADQARSEVSRAAAAVQVARQGVSVAASDLSYGVLTAPFDGTVSRRLAHVGDLATPGRALLELQDTTRLHLEVSVPEESMRRVTPGTRIPVHLDALGKTVPGRVYSLVPSSDPSTHTVLIKIALTRTGGLVPGLYGEARVKTGQRRVLRVPETALVRRGDLVGVYTVDNGVAGLHWLRLSGHEVLSGLDDGARIVVSPLDRLTEGTPVVPESDVR